MSTGRTLCTIACFAAAALPVVAQDVRVTFAGGTATDIRGVRSGAVSLVPTVGFGSPYGTSMLVSGRGTRFETGEWAAGAGMSVEARTRHGRGVGFRLNAEGNYTATSFDATFAAIEATPALEFHLGPLEAFGGVRGAAARTAYSPPQLPRPELLAPAETSDGTAYGPVFGVTLDLPPPRPGRALAVSYREERSTASRILVTDRIAGARFLAGPLSVAGHVGRRDAADEDASYGGARAAVMVSPMVALIAVAESYPSNRLTGTLGGRTLSAGVAIRLGPTGRRGVLPRPEGAAPVPGGLTRLSIRAEEASVVEIAGDWSRWRPEPARRARNGVWYVDLRLPPGDYRYAFRIDGKEWAVPGGAATVRDGFGGKSAWVTVRSAGGTSRIDSTSKEE